MKHISAHYSIRLGISVLLVLQVACRPAAKPVEHQYFMSFCKMDAGNFEIMFPADAANTVYRSAYSALDIISVKVDGKDVEPTDITIAGRPDLTPVRAPAGTIMYRLLHVPFHCWRDPYDQVAPSNKMRTFVLPEERRKLEVRYRVRYPNRTVSDPQTITYCISESPPTWFDMPCDN